MRLGNFKVGDKIHCPGALVPEDRRSRYSTIIFVGKLNVVLQPEFGTEFVQSVDRDDLELWRPERSYEELRKENERLRKIGFDLYTSIRDAAWIEIDYRTGTEKPNLHGPTPHMIVASVNWRTEVEEDV